MRRNAFTMIELIVVIMIIGILVTMAVPKFDKIKNLAKVNSEVASVTGLDSVIMAEMEIRSKDYGDSKVNWHNYIAMNDASSANRAAHYKKINDEQLVFSAIAKHNKFFKIVGYKEIDKEGKFTFDDGLFYDALVIKVEATKSDTGAKYPVDALGQDIKGSPDKNDFWVFNPSSVDLTIGTKNATIPINKTIVKSGEIALIDVNGTIPVSAMTDISLQGIGDGSTFSAVAE